MQNALISGVLHQLNKVRHVFLEKCAFFYFRLTPIILSAAKLLWQR